MIISNIAENIFSMAEIAKEYGVKVYICSVLPAIDFPGAPNLNLKPAQKIIALNQILKKYCDNNNKINYDQNKLAKQFYGMGQQVISRI